MKRKYLLLICLIATIFSLKLSAQNDIYRIEQIKKENFVSENKQSKVVFSSSFNDLFIVDVLYPDANIKSSGKDAKGNYLYEVLIDSKKTPKRRFVISRKGDSREGELTEVFHPGQCYYFHVTKVAEPITVQETTKKTSGQFKDEAQASVEFTAPMKGLVVKMDTYNKSASPTVSTSVAANGSFVTTMVFNLSRLSTWEQQIAEYKTSLGSLTDDDYEKKEELENKIDSLSAFTNFNLRISTEKSQVCAVEISNLRPKQKREFAVVLVERVDTVKTHVTEFQGFQSAAMASMKERKFSAAKQEYEKALAAKDCPADMKNVLQEKIDLAERCANNNDIAQYCLLQLKEIKNGGKQASATEIEKYYAGAIDAYSVIYKETNDEQFNAFATQLKGKLAALPIVVAIKVMGVKKKGGTFIDNPLPGVKVYGVSQEFSEALKKGAHGTFLGVCDEKGYSRLELKNGEYSGLLFVPDGIDYKENGYQSLVGKNHLSTEVRLYK